MPLQIFDCVKINGMVVFFPVARVVILPIPPEQD